MIFSGNDRQAPFSGSDNSQLFSNLYLRSGPSSSLYNSSSFNYQSSNTLGSLSFPITSQTTIDVSSFESRIHNLQLKLSEQNEISNMCNEKNNYLVSKITSDLTQNITDIRSNIDIILQSDIRKEGRRILEGFKNTKKNIDSLDFNNDTSETRSRLIDLTRNISLFKNNLSDLSDVSHNSFRKLKIDQQRVANQSNQSYSRINNIESRFASIIQQSDEQNRLLDQVDEKTLSSFSSFADNSAELIQSSSNNIASSIKTESSIRESVNMILQKQANSINENVKTNLTRLMNDFKEIHKSFNKMIQNTNSKISSSIEDAQSATDSMILNINNSFNPLFEDIQKNFELLQNELVSTITSLSKSSNSSLSEIEEVLEVEAQTRKKNLKIFNDKFNQFEKFIIEEKRIQKGKIKEITKKINSDLFDKQMAEPIEKVDYIVKTIEKLDEIESKIDSIENEFNESLKSIQDDIRDYDLNAAETYARFEINKNEFLKSFDFIEKSISNLEPKRLDSKIEFKKFVDNKSNEFNQVALKRIENANKKIDAILLLLKKNDISLTSESNFNFEESEAKNETPTDKFNEIEIEEEEEEKTETKEKVVSETNKTETEKENNKTETKTKEVDSEANKTETKTKEVDSEANKTETETKEVDSEANKTETEKENNKTEIDTKEDDSEANKTETKEKVDSETDKTETKEVDSEANKTETKEKVDSEANKTETEAKEEADSETNKTEIKVETKNEVEKIANVSVKSDADAKHEEEDKNENLNANEIEEEEEADKNENHESEQVDDNKDRNVSLNPIKSIGSAILANLTSDNDYKLNASDFDISFVDPRKK